MEDLRANNQINNQINDSRYHTLIESIDQGFCVCEMLFSPQGQPIDYRFLEINNKYESMTGLTQVIGKTARELIPALEDFWFETYAQVVLTGKSVRFENRVAAMNQWFDVNAFAIDAPNQHKFGILFTDISDRKAADHLLRQSEDRLRLCIESTKMGTWDLDLITDKLLWSEQNFRLFGYLPTPTGEATEEMWRSRIHPEDSEMVDLLWQKSLAERTQFRSEHRMIPFNDQKTIWIEVLGSFVYGADGQAIRSTGVIFDISDRKYLEEALFYSRERLNLVLDSADLGLWYCDLPFDLLEWNDTCKQHFGLTPDAEVNIDLFYELLHPDDREHVQQKITESIEQQLKYDMDYRTVATNGVIHWIRAIGKAFYDSAGKPIRFDGVTIDMTKPKEVEQALFQSETRYRHLAESIPQLVWISDQTGMNEYVNHKMCEYTGLNFNQLMGIDWQVIIHPDDWQYTYARWTTAIQQNILYENEYRLRSADGSYRWHLGRAIPVRDEQGNTLKWFGTATDMEDQKQLEYQRNLILKQTQERNQELDQFAHIVSHDLKAPLRAIANISEWLEEDLGEILPAENKVQLQLLRSRVQRMDGLLNGILEYAKLGRTQNSVETISVQALLAEIIDILLPPPSFLIEIAPNMPTLDTQATLLRQVFMNLIDNAIKHHPDPEGWVNVSVRELGDFYEFAIADNGNGIEPESHQRIFAIFQTLSSNNNIESTGVGLAIVKKIVEKEGGKIDLESEVGRGSTFRFTWRKSAII